MQDILLESGNNAQKILPVPYSAPPTPSVAKPNNFGNAPYPIPLSSLASTSSRKDDELQYCNFLEPSPRDQRLNVPYEGEKNCPTFKTQPYGKDSCYLLDSKSQGVVGIVCNEAGGSDNANFYRGNQFGVDYPFNSKDLVNKKNLEYIVNKPVQIPLELENPMVVYDKNTFYPEPSFPLRKDPNFLTYPLQPNYTKDGLPTYTYPYKTLNPIFEDPNQKDIDIVEQFESIQTKTTQTFFIFLLIAIFIIFLFLKSN
jgi:hypothetical protein